jgi:hypothetical protein
MKKVSPVADLLRVIQIGDGFLLMNRPDQIVCGYKVFGGVDPWIEDVEGIKNKIKKFENALAQIKVDEQIQIIFKKIPIKEKCEIQQWELQNNVLINENFIRYKKYYDHWLDQWIKSGKLCRYETFIFFSILKSRNLFLGKNNSNDHWDSLIDLTSIRSRSWSEYLTGCGIKIAPIQSHEIIKLLSSEMCGSSNYLNFSKILNSSSVSFGKNSFLTISEKLARLPLKFEKNYFQMGDIYGKTFFVSEFADVEERPAFLTYFLTQPNIFKINIFAHGIDQMNAKKNVERQLKWDLSSLQKGNLINAESQAQLELRQRAMDELARGETKLIQFSMYITAYSSDLRKLFEISDNFMSHIGIFNAFDGYFEQKELFICTLPQNKNISEHEFLITTKSLSNCYPFFENSLSQISGNFLGVNLNNELICHDPWSSKLENWNAIVIGKSGSGKSFFIQQQIIRAFSWNPFIVIIDRSKSYELICYLYGGQYVYIDLNGSIQFNLFDTDEELLRKNQGVISSEKMSDLLGFLTVVLTEEKQERLPNVVVAYIEEAIQMTYKRIFHENPLHPIPLLRDLKKTLLMMGEDVKIISEYRMLCIKYSKMLDPYTENGVFSNLTDRPSNFKMQATFVVFDTSRLPENLVSLGVYVISQFCLNQAEVNKKNGKKTWLLIDEAWFLAKFAAGIYLLMNLAKRSRHIGLSSIFATQQLSDFLKNVDVRPVLDNATCKFIFKPGENDLSLLQEILAFNSQEMNLLKQLQQIRGQYSQCFCILGNLGKGIAHIVADPVSYWIATTHPTEVLERENYFKKNIKEIQGMSVADLWSLVFSFVASKLEEY